MIPILYLFMIRTTLDSLYHFENNALVDYQEISELPGDENRVGMYLRDQTLLINFSNTGEVLDFHFNQMLSSGGAGATEIVYSKDGNYGMVSRIGAIVDGNLEYVDALESPIWPQLVSAWDFVFDPNTDYVYSFQQDMMYKHSVPEGKFVESFKLPYKIIRVFRNNEGKNGHCG